MQPAGRRRVGRHPFADHHRQRAAAQTLFHRPQQIDRPAGGRQDQAIGIDAEPNETGAIRQPGGLAAATQTDMQDAAGAAGQPASQRHGEAAGRRIFFGTHDIMQAAARQTAPWQRRIERRIAEAQCSAAAARTFQLDEVPAKMGQIESGA